MNEPNEDNYVTHLAIVPVFEKVDNTICPLDKSLSTYYYYFIFCTVIILKKLKSKYMYCLATMSCFVWLVMVTSGEIAYKSVLSCCVIGESQKMMPEKHSSWQEAMPSTLLLCLLHGLNLSYY